MNELKIGFVRMPVHELSGLAHGVSHALTTLPGSADFASVNPPAAAIMTAISEYDAALALETSKSATQLRKARRKDLINILQRVAASCELIANGDRVMLSHSGFEFRKKTERTHFPPAKPENLRLKTAPLSGGIIAKVEPVASAGSYEMQTTADNINGPWSPSSTHTNSQNMTKTGLPPLTIIFVRVRAIGSNGPSEWSDIAQIAVL